MTECNVLVAQSGGPTTVINSSLAGVIAGALADQKVNKIYGARHGIVGVLKEDLVALDEVFGGNEELLGQLKITPSM